MPVFPPGRTTRDGDLDLLQKSELPSEPEASFGAPEPAPGGAGPAVGAAGSGGTGPRPGGYTYVPQLDPLATASLICGVLGIAMICCCGLFTLVLAPLAVVLGVISIMRIRKDPEHLTGEAMAGVGVGTGVAAFLFWLMYFLFVGGVQVLSALEQM
jgi:hypothetical protein